MAKNESAWDALLLGDFEDDQEMPSLKLSKSALAILPPVIAKNPSSQSLPSNNNNVSSKPGSAAMTSSSSAQSAQIHKNRPSTVFSQLYALGSTTNSIAEVSEPSFPESIDDIGVDDFSETIKAKVEVKRGDTFQFGDTQTIKLPNTIKAKSSKSSGQTDSTALISETDTVKFIPRMIKDSSGKTTSINSANNTIVGVETPPPLSIRSLTNNQVEDLETFMNDDDVVLPSSSSKTSFGSFLSPNAVAAAGTSISTKSSLTSQKSKDKLRSPMKRDERMKSSHSHIIINSFLSSSDKRTVIDINGNREELATLSSLIETSTDTLLEMLLIANAAPSIPQEVFKARELTRLDVSFNQLMSIPEDISKLRNLVYLSANGNQIMDVKSVASLKILKELHLHMNNLTSIPQAFTKMKLLHTVDISCNRLTVFPKELCHLHGLEYLDLSGNLISEVGVDLKQLKSLKTLLLTDNSLRTVPKILFKLGNLELLDLSSNEIESVTNDIETEHLKLKELVLRQNCITEIPSSISKLINLEILDVRQNHLQTFSPHVGQLKKLKKILLSEDYMDLMIMPPVKVCALGTNAILKYLQDLLKGIADPENSYADGDGLDRIGKVRTAAQFVIKAVDKYGNAKTSGGDEFEVTVETLTDSSQADICSVKPQDNNDGTYTVLYDAKKAGKYRINVKSNDCHIKGSPYEFHLEPESNCSKFCFVRIPSEKNPCQNLMLFAGEKKKLLLTLRDMFQNVISNDSGQISAQVDCLDKEMSVQFKSNIKKLPDGLYELDLLFTKAGTCQIQISILGEPIQNSPVDVLVNPGPVDEKMCTISASGTKVAEMNCQTSFIIQAKDAFGNMRQRLKDSFKVTISGPDGKDVPTEISSNFEHAEYFVSYTPRQIGRYKISVMFVNTNLKESHISGSPLIVFVSDERESKLLALQKENNRLTNALAETSKTVERKSQLSLSSDRSPRKSLLISNDISDFIIQNSTMIKSFIQPVPALLLIDMCNASSPNEVIRPIQELIAHITNLNMDTDSDLLYYWLSNLVLLRQFWITYQSEVNHPIQKSITETAEMLYKKLVKCLQNWLSPVIVTAFLESSDNQQSQQFESFRSLNRKKNGTTRKTALDHVINFLTTCTQNTEKYCFELQISLKLLKEVFKFIDAILFNSMLLRKNLCSKETAERIEANLKLLKDWSNEHCSEQKLELNYLEEAVELLKLPISTDESISSLTRIGFEYLTTHQLEKLIRNAFETMPDDRVLSTVKLLAGKKKNQSGKSTIERSVQIFLDTFHVSFLYSSNDEQSTQVEKMNNINSRTTLGQIYYPPALERRIEDYQQLKQMANMEGKEASI